MLAAQLRVVEKMALKVLMLLILSIGRLLLCDYLCWFCAIVAPTVADVEVATKSAPLVRTTADLTAASRCGAILMLSERAIILRAVKVIHGSASIALVAHIFLKLLC